MLRDGARRRRGAWRGRLERARVWRGRGDGGAAAASGAATRPPGQALSGR